jgi:hypothetical protein
VRSRVSRRERLVRRPLATQPGSSLGRSWWFWIPAALGVLYVILSLAQLGSLISVTNLDADSASGPVIAELFGSAGPHATVVLGTFGWYSTLIFDLATKWLPLHRQIWEGAPYLMALGAAGLTAWSSWQIAGRRAALLTAVLMVCAAPHTVHLLLSTTEHGPDWFCLALLGGYLVFVARPQGTRNPLLLALTTLVVGIIIGINAASDALVAVAGLVPFALALVASYLRRRDSATTRALSTGGAAVLVVAVSWGITRAVMSSAHVIHQPGVSNTMLAQGDQVASNFKLWWQSIAVLGNGDFFGRPLSFTAGLAVVCAGLSIGAVLLLPRIGWREVRMTPGPGGAESSARMAFIFFWCSSAVLLTVAFLISATPVDINADRYLVGLVYAAAAVIPVIAVARPVTEKLAVAGVSLFALAAVISMANGTYTSNPGVNLSDGEVNSVIRLAEQNDLTVGYAGYWDAAPITWASHTRLQVYPVLTCGGHLCPFYLHYISSWYQTKPGIRSFLLTDTGLPFVPAPTPDLGAPSAIYHAGTITMYVYPYDIASRIS